MGNIPNQIDVYLEIGLKKVFAGALNWPGWNRSGRDEAAALQSLYEHAPRYAGVLAETQLGFVPPTSPSDLKIIERLKGNSTTDFGAPDVAPSLDSKPVDKSELQRFQAILQACWQAFDAASQAAYGKELRKGPRGGGRDLDKIAQHVIGADSGYLSRLGIKFQSAGESGSPEEFVRLREVILDGLASATRGELPARGPRGGVLWTPRYYVRRAAWHVLDHVWEIEDRIL
jgi:hypothetical protein